MGDTSGSVLPSIEHLSNYFSSDVDDYIELQASTERFLKKKGIHFGDDLDIAVVEAFKSLSALHKTKPVALGTKKAYAAQFLQSINIDSHFRELNSNNSESPHHILPFASVDIAIKPEGDLAILEINDRPLSFGANEIVTHLAKQLINISKSRPIFLVLPDFISIETAGTTSNFLELETLKGTAAEEITIKRLVALNKLSKEIHIAGGSAIMVPASEVEVDESNEAIFKGVRAGAIFNYSELFPRRLLSTPVLNDSRARLLCLDKYSTFNILSGCFEKRFLPETFILEDNNEKLIDFLSAILHANEKVFVKNRIGTSAVGAGKVPAQAVLSHSDNLEKQFGDCVIQECIDLPCLSVGGKDYRFDITVGVLFGKAVSIRLNTAAAPVDSLKEHPLNYITTMGRKFSAGHVEGISSDVTDFINLLAEKAVKEMSKAVETVEYTDALEFSESYLERYSDDESLISGLNAKF